MHKTFLLANKHQFHLHVFRNFIVIKHSLNWVEPIDGVLPLVSKPFNRPFPLRKSKKILKVLSIIGFITHYTRRMQALHHLSQGSYLPSQFAPSHFLEADTTGHHFVLCEENQPHNQYSLYSFVPYSVEHLLLVP